MIGLKRSEVSHQVSNVLGALRQRLEDLLAMGQHVGRAGGDVQVGEVRLGARV